MLPNATCDVVIGWAGLPWYATRLIGRAVDRSPWRMGVVATPGPCDRDEIEGALSVPVRWVRHGSPCTWETLGLDVPKVFCYTGFFYPEFNSLAGEVRRQGGKTISMIDNSYKRTIKQAIGSVIFRCRLRRRIDMVFVPGADGARLMHRFGLDRRDVRVGLYGADPTVFPPGPPLEGRQRDFIYVGQFIERKGIPTLIAAVQDLRASGTGCTLLAVGDGPLKAALKAAEIPVLGFCQPEIVAREMRKTKFLILPSKLDHWGLVVHEAALSACGLILSDGVGSRHDLLRPDNGFVFEAGNPESLAATMRSALTLQSTALEQCCQVSMQLAEQFGPDQWAETFLKAVELLLQSACSAAV